MRILLVTQMWPSPENPDLGAFLVPLTRELKALGHEVEVVSISKRGGGPAKYAQLTTSAVAAARRFRPEVVFAHFLYPAGFAGAAASLAARAPLVVMAHGQDVANIGEIAGVTQAIRAIVHRASAVIANSRWLADRLVAQVPAAQEKLAIANCGVDLDAFSPQPAEANRAELGWQGDGPAFLCVGSLIERKNVVALADAFAEFGRGRLAFVGDGPLRQRLEGRHGVRIIGRVPPDAVPRWVAACDVLCQPSLIEPFGQATLEGMAMERSVIATAVGGPPEFVTPEAGIIVDPRNPQALTDALDRAAEFPRPNAAARAAAAEHDVRGQARLMAEVLEHAVASQGGVGNNGAA